MSKFDRSSLGGKDGVKGETFADPSNVNLMWWPLGKEVLPDCLPEDNRNTVHIFGNWGGRILALDGESQPDSGLTIDEIPGQELAERFRFLVFLMYDGWALWGR
jgi:hypothetical protein